MDLEPPSRLEFNCVFDLASNDVSLVSVDSSCLVMFADPGGLIGIFWWGHRVVIWLLRNRSRPSLCLVDVRCVGRRPFYLVSISRFLRSSRLSGFFR